MNAKPNGVVYNLAGRVSRREAASRGDAPADFFYGALPWLADGNSEIIELDSRAQGPAVFSFFFVFFERAFSRIFGYSISVLAYLGNKKLSVDCRSIISFIDSYSITLGFSKSFTPDKILIGGFHGLSDLYFRSPRILRPVSKRLLRFSVNNLDHIFFFGEADMNKAIELYNINESNCSLYRFGIDTSFWKPDDLAKINRYRKQKFVIAIGSDINRDYETLIKAAKFVPSLKIKILTKLVITSLVIPENVEVLTGNLHGSKFSDRELLALYCAAEAVVVPVRKCYQPSGYSVCLQAMACGKCVVISDFAGLWSKDQLKHQENCLLVKPEDSKSLAATLDFIRSNDARVQEIGKRARRLVIEDFTVEHMNNSFEKLLGRKSI